MALLRHPLIRKKLKIPERIKHPASALPQSDGLIESMKKGWCCEHKSVDKQSRTINLVVVCSTLFPLWLFLCLSVLELVWSAGWKNAQLAHQLEERERRIKNHLDLAAKGQSQSSAHPQRPFGLCRVFSSLQKNDSLYLEGGRKKLYLKWLLIYINSDPSTFVVLPSTLQTDTRHSQFIGVEFTRFYFEGLFTADPLPDPSCQSATLSGGRPVCCSPCSVMEQVENGFMCWKAAGLELIVVCICS